MSKNRSQYYIFTDHNNEYRRLKWGQSKNETKWEFDRFDRIDLLSNGFVLINRMNSTLKYGRAKMK